MTEEEVQAIQNLTTEMRDQRREMAELQKWLRDQAVGLTTDITILKGKAHSPTDCDALQETNKTVKALWDSRNKFLGVAAGIGIGSSLGVAGVLKFLGTL